MAENEGLPLVKLGDLIDKRETEAISLAPVFGAEGVEALKSPFAGEVGDPFTLIENMEANLRFFDSQIDRDGSTFRGKLDGVFDQVIEGGTKKGFVAGKSKFIRKLPIKCDFLGLGQCAHLFKTVTASRGQIELMGVLEMSLGLERRQLE